MTAADNSNVVQFASPADAIGDLIERLVDATVRLSQLEAMAADGADLFARLDAFDARLTALEKRQRRPPPFAVTLISNETRKPEPAETHPLVEKIWQRLIDEQVERQLKPVFSSLHQQAAEFAKNRETIAKMREAWTAMAMHIAKVEAQVKVAKIPGGP